MASRARMLVVALVGFGLLMLMAGGILINVGHSHVTGETTDQMNARLNLADVWGPSAIDVGLFLLVSGLILGAIALEDLDLFVRLFLLILAFVSVLIILANPRAFFA